MDSSDVQLTPASFPRAQVQEFTPSPIPAPSRKRVETTGSRWRADSYQRLAYVAWFILLCNPQFVLASMLGIESLRKTALMAYAVVVLAMLLKPRRGDMLWVVFAWVASHIVGYVLATDHYLALEALKRVIIPYVAGLAISRAARTPRSVLPAIFMLCVVQYLWFGAFGLITGGVSWDPEFANYDDFSALMAIGVGPAYYYATSTNQPWRRRLGFAAAAVCACGVVSGFARGAVLSMVITAAYIWFRSPRKGRASLVLGVGAVMAAIVASSIDGSTRGDDTNSNFWVEMSTMFEEGGTRADREVLWGAARRIFQNHPILGAGPSNFGVAAANELRVGDVGGNYADNPKTLYSRALHNIYYQTLSEQGIVGFAILLALLGQFWIRNRALTRRDAAARWRELGGDHDLGAIARGLECGLLTFLACGWFYNMFLVSGFWGIIIANTLLYRITRRRGNRAPPLSAGSTMNAPSYANAFAFGRSV